MTKIISWNVNGIRSILRKDVFYPMVSEYLPDIICLQEVRALPNQFILNESFILEYPYRYYNNPTQKKGYSGVSVFSKIEPLRIELTAYPGPCFSPIRELGPMETC